MSALGNPGLDALMAEMQDVSVQAQRLAASVQAAVGGSATGLDRELSEALSSVARSMRRAAQAVAATRAG